MKRLLTILLTLSLIFALTACGSKKNTGDSAREQGSNDAAAEEPETPLTAEEPRELSPITVSTPEDIQNELYAAICAVRQPVSMNISGVALSDAPELDVTNLYYALMSRYPQLKYAYDISPAAQDGWLTCAVSYMPYKTGSWPEECANAPEIATLGALLRAAEEHLGADPFKLRITDASLAPDDMDRVLRQAGGGYIFCALNRDATAITFIPDTAAMEECLASLRQANELADQVITQVVNDGMNEREKAEALYGYLTSHVQYDQRYYSDRGNMPHESQTAIGALRDGLAICGGYSHALRLLFEKAGIPCYNVTGNYFGESHMWNTAYLDGAWLWFDATSDRGASQEQGFRHFALKELDPVYEWRQEDAELLWQMKE